MRELADSRLERIPDEVPAVEIVDREHVDPVEAEALEAVLVGPHDGVVAVVEASVEAQAARPERVLSLAAARNRREQAPDLRRDHDAVAFDLTHEASDPVLAQPEPVLWRGVDQCHTFFRGGLEHRLGAVVADEREQVAERRGAEAQPRHLEPAAADLDRRQLAHARSSASPSRSAPSRSHVSNEYPTIDSP